MNSEKDEKKRIRIDGIIKGAGIYTIIAAALYITTAVLKQNGYMLINTKIEYWLCFAMLVGVFVLIARFLMNLPKTNTYKKVVRISSIALCVAMIFLAFTYTRNGINDALRVVATMKSPDGQHKILLMRSDSIFTYNCTTTVYRAEEFKSTDGEDEEAVSSGKVYRIEQKVNEDIQDPIKSTEIYVYEELNELSAGDETITSQGRAFRLITIGDLDDTSDTKTKSYCLEEIGEEDGQNNSSVSISVNCIETEDDDTNQETGTTKSYNFYSVNGIQQQSGQENENSMFENKTYRVEKIKEENTIETTVYTLYRAMPKRNAVFCDLKATEDFILIKDDKEAEIEMQWTGNTLTLSTKGAALDGCDTITLDLD